MTKQDYITRLNLQKHPEGGYFKEVYRAPQSFQPEGFDGDRNYLTSIYFLLERNQVSHFHRILSDELWYYHGGAPCRVYQIDAKGVCTHFDLGLELTKGEQPFGFVPSGNIFGAEALGDFTLVSCAVSPGFDFKDFTLMTTSDLLQRYPEHASLIKRFTKEKYH